jgi:hypothetical protein
MKVTPWYLVVCVNYNIRHLGPVAFIFLPQNRLFPWGKLFFVRLLNLHYYGLSLQRKWLSIESWYKYPLESVPESEKYSMTYIVKDVIKQIKFGQKAGLSSIDLSNKNPVVNTTYVDNWQFEGKVDGWIDQSDIEEMRSVDGALYINCNGNDPYILSPERLNINAKSYKRLHIRIKNMTRSTSLRVFFITNADSNMDEQKSYVAPLTSGDSGYTDVYIDLASNSLWKGTIIRLRIDPGDQPGEVYIDSISLE